MLAAGFLCLVIACSARAADSIYWVNIGTNTISHANLVGGGGGQVPIAPAFMTDPGSIGVDARSGKLYWTNVPEDVGGSSSIGSANLDGSGAGQLNVAGALLENPSGLAIDANAGKVYWSDDGQTPAISFANLSGGGGGALNTTGAVLREPDDLVIHPATGKVYWDDENGIFFANLNGSGGGSVLVPAEGTNSLAIDASSNRLYWIDSDTNTIHFISLAGGASGVLDTGTALGVETIGLAIDPEAGRIYWADFNKNTIGFASLKGGGVGQLDTTGATLSGPLSPVLLKTPLATATPLIKGRHRAGSRLTCEGGSWAGDLPESRLYRVPQTVGYQWLRNGRPIAGATATTVKANKVGRYTCQSIATNFAGSTAATSTDVAVKAALKLGKLRLNPVAGTATLKVAAFGAGKLTLKGAGVKRRVAKASPKARLRIAPTRRLKKRLEDTGRARVKVKITFRPSGGKRIQRSKTVALRAR